MPHEHAQPNITSLQLHMGKTHVMVMVELQKQKLQMQVWGFESH